MAKKEKSLKDQWDLVPGWFKIIVGLAGICITLKFFPIVEILNLFALIVLVPLCLFASVGLIADGAGEATRNVWNTTMDRARQEAQNIAAK